MADDNNVLDALRTASKKGAGECIVAVKAAELDATDQATFNEAMWGDASHDITAAAIMRHARDEWGWSFSTTTLRSHRRKGCGCEFT